MRTSKKDKAILASLLTDVISCHRLRLDGIEIEKLVELIAIYCHVKPETIEGWEHITFDPVECCCTKYKRSTADVVQQ